MTRLKLWKLLTDPSHSRAARIYAYVALVFVLLAIFSFCASTHQLFAVSEHHNVTVVGDTASSSNSYAYQQQQNTTDLTIRVVEPKNSSNNNDTSILNPTNITNTTRPPTTTPNESDAARNVYRRAFSARIHPVLFVIDIVCLIFFAVEYLVKLACASPRRQFVKSLTAIFDVLAVAPDLIELLIYVFYPSLLAGTVGFIEFLPFLRLMRAFRIFRLIRRVPGLWIMMYTLRASFKELSLMLIFLLVGTMLFASIIFFVDDTKVFTSIPHGFWWAIITMTTVGYGDMAPVTAWGQIVGSVTAICGVLIVGFTIPSLVNNFITYYNHVEFVVQKERLLKIIAQEEENEKLELEERKAALRLKGKSASRDGYIGGDGVNGCETKANSRVNGGSGSGVLQGLNQTTSASAAGDKTGNTLVKIDENLGSGDEGCVDEEGDEEEEEEVKVPWSQLYPHRAHYSASMTSLKASSTEKVASSL